MKTVSLVLTIFLLTLFFTPFTTLANTNIDNWRRIENTPAGEELLVVLKTGKKKEGNKFETTDFRVGNGKENFVGGI